MNHEFKKRLITSIILICLFFLMFLYNYLLLYFLIIITVISFIEFFNLIKKIKNIFNLKVFFSLIFLIYVSLISFTIFTLSQSLSTKLLTFFLILICFLSDIGGLIFGKTFKGPKLTKISPNKTIAGSIGCFILPVFVSFIFSILELINFNLNLIIFILITTLFCQLGDVFISLLKRKAKLKDTGNFLPGHGGLLDRVDSIILGFPAGLITFYIMS